MNSRLKGTLDNFLWIGEPAIYVGALILCQKVLTPYHIAAPFTVASISNTPVCRFISAPALETLTYFFASMT
jgi:hypothetical protein